MSESFDPYYRWLAIPPHEQPPNHYRLLGVPLFEANLDVIETAADGRMGLLRSFQTGKRSAQSQKLLNEVAAARVCLLTPAKKTAYDEVLRRELAAKVSPQPIPTVQPLEPPLHDVLLSLATSSESKPTRGTSPRHRNTLGLTIAATAIGGLVIVGIAILATRGHEEPTKPVTEMTAKPVPPKAASAVAPTAWLDDLVEVEAHVGFGVLGKHGDTGYGTRCTLAGTSYSHALSLHAGRVPSYVTYELGGKYRSFQATAGVIDGDADPKSPLEFKVFADDKLLWASRPLPTTGSREECVVDLPGVNRLRLEVTSQGSPGFGRGAWLNPRLSGR